jgi:beta-N-acetylhexosaminidase
MKLPVGELFIIGFHGTELSAPTRSLITDHGVGGVILFSRNITDMEQVVTLNQSLFALSAGRSPIIVSVDQEGGRVARLRHICTEVPSMRTVGMAARTDAELPYRLGAMMARELSALGFHWDFAPVVDVDTNPNNPVIGERSFSRNAVEVGAIAARFIAGMQGAGVAACAKHFPGHGDTDVDSHLALPRLPHSLDRLQAVELVPFQQAIAADVASIMTAHVTFPALDDAPATLSAPVLDGLLRKQLRYQGLVVSDDLEMGAVAELHNVEELVRRGLLAGVDAFLICHDHDKAARAVESVHRLVASGEVPRTRIEQAIARVGALKQRYLGTHAAPELADARQLLRSAPHIALADILKRSQDSGPVRGDSLVDLA